MSHIPPHPAESHRRVRHPLLAVGLAAALAVPVLVADAAPASAQVRIRVGGHLKVRVGARARVRVGHRHRRHHRPFLTPPPPHRLHVGARVVIGGGLVLGPTFAEPPPPPVYAPCGCCSCDPGVPAYYAPPPPPQPIATPPSEVPVVVAEPPAPLARFGLGLFVGSVSLEDEQQGDDFGLLARYRLTPGWAIEAELGKTKMQEGSEERRVGAGILFDFAGRARLSPYLVAAAGSWDGRRYAEGGAGLTYRLTPSFHIAADLRAGVHCETCAEDSAPVDQTGATASVARENDINGSRYARGRLSAIVHF